MAAYHLNVEPTQVTSFPGWQSTSSLCAKRHQKFLQKKREDDVAAQSQSHPKGYSPKENRSQSKVDTWG